MLIPSCHGNSGVPSTSLSRRVNANSQPWTVTVTDDNKLIKKGEC